MDFPMNELAPDPTFSDLRSVIRQLHESSEAHNIGLHRVLHDDLGGLIVSAAMDLAAASMHLKSVAPADVRLTRAHKSMMTAVDLNRSLAERLRPSLLDNFGLFAALRWHLRHDCAHSSAECSEHFPEEEIKLTPEATTTLFRIGQESLALVFSEPDLESVNFQINLNHGQFEMTLAHQHVEHEPVDLFGNAPDRMHALAERARSLNGYMSVSRYDAGTAVILRFPIERIT